MGTMSKEEILKILEDAKDKNGDVPMRLVRQAFEKLPEPCEDAEFWRKRAEYYVQMCLDLIANMNQGVKYYSVEINDDRIKFTMKHPEPLTDKEQMIFLAAMEREEQVCEEVDRNYVHEPYEDRLMQVCKEIRRKVKDALWT